jgi:hypothetical protein
MLTRTSANAELDQTIQGMHHFKDDNCIGRLYEIHVQRIPLQPNNLKLIQEK